MFLNIKIIVPIDLVFFIFDLKLLQYNYLIKSKRSKKKKTRFFMKKLEFDYAGHVARWGMDRWERKVMDWIPRGTKKKKVGRPTIR